MKNFASVTLMILFCSSVISANKTLEARGNNSHHHHELYYHHHILYYLTFLAIKVKLVLVIGVILTVITFAGKLFAIVKYAEYAKHERHHPYESKIYFQPPHEGIESIKDHHDFPGPPGVDEPYRRYSTINVNSGNKYNRRGQNLNGYKRSIDRKGFFGKFLALMMRLNLTDTIFREMKLERVDCRKKFVCETQWIAEKSTLFRIAMKLMSDSTYKSYEQKNGTTSIDDCTKLYPYCEVK